MRAYSSESGNNMPLLILDNVDDPSWFYPQDGHFANNVLPPRKSNIFPPDFNANVATQRPACFSFKDPNLKDLFEAKQLDKAILDSLAFSDSNPIGIKSSPLSNIDTLLRSIMFDFMIIDKLFTFMVDVHKLAKLEISASPGNPDSPAFNLLFDIMALAARTSLKASQFLTAAFVANRVALRETVLDKFDAHESSRETLRGGSFASKNLFGPLPEHFKEKLNAPLGERFMFTLKTSSSNAAKRRGSGISTAPKKRKVQTRQNSQFPQFFQSPQNYQSYAPQGTFPKTTTPSYSQKFQNLKTKARGRGFPKKRGGYT